MPRTTPSDVRDELDVSTSEYSDSDADTDIRRANYIVNARIADRLDDTPENETLLSDIETLVAAHLAFEEFSEATRDGQTISSVTQGTAQVSYDTDGTESVGPGGYPSAFWGQATMLDPTGRLGVRTAGVNTTVSDVEGH